MLRDFFGRFNLQGFGQRSPLRLPYSAYHTFWVQISQPKAHWTAFFHIRIFSILVSSFNSGIKIRSDAQFFLTSSLLFQYPTESPARYAAPIAVVSTQTGRLTGAIQKSACICINRLLALAPPSAFRHERWIPESASMARRTSFAWNAMDSNAARMMWCLLMPRVSPTIVPLAY